MRKRVIISTSEEIVGASEAFRRINARYFDGTDQVADRQIYFRIRGSGAGSPLPNSDYAVLSLLFGAMRYGRDIRLEGVASHTTLMNLEEFQAIFRSWKPGYYHEVDIEAAEVDRTTDVKSDRAVAAFSGGVDACFTTFRHYHRTPGKYHFPISAVMLIHGFDVPLGNQQAFAATYAGAQTILTGMDLDLISVETNVRTALPDWEWNFGAGLAACLNAIGGNFGVALVGSDEPYADLQLPWGSNPVSNHLLSTKALRFVTDGGGFTRTEKVAHVADWPGALNGVRVCWEGPVTGKNCGHCEKCRRTILNFKAVGIESPPAFGEVGVTDAEILEIPLRNAIQVAYIRDIYRQALKNGITASWVDAVHELLERHKKT